MTSEELREIYPLYMGRYLTEEEREHIKELLPEDTGPDWSAWGPGVSLG